MKKILLNTNIVKLSIAAIVLLVMCVTFSVRVQAATVSVPYKYGDLNHDSIIDITDYLKIERHINASSDQSVASKHPDWILSGNALKAADVNYDGRITSTDADLVLEHIAAQKGSGNKTILTVTLASGESGTVYNCFPVIYDKKAPNNCRYPVLPSVRQTGYTFQGWYTGLYDRNRVYSQSVVTCFQDHVLYARMSRNQYKVYFNANGGSCSVSCKIIPYAEFYGSLPTAMRSGYTFAGWYTAQNGGSRITEATRMGTSSVTVYAHWKVETVLSLNKTSITLYVGKTYPLRVSVEGKSGSKKWSSSNSKVASVNSSGLVCAKKTGTAKITVRVNGFSKTCVVKVQKPSISLNKSKVTLTVNGTQYLSANICGPSKKVKWTSSNNSVVKVASNGKIKGIKPGKATITAMANGVRVRAVVTVNYVDIKNYIADGAGSNTTVLNMRRLANVIEGMRGGRNSKYPNLYYSGNKMVIGVNNSPVYGTAKNEYVRIANNGNKKVLFFGVRIGDTKTQMERKFSAHKIRSTNGRSYSNANSWDIYPKFSHGRLVSYVYVCRPNSK